MIEVKALQKAFVQPKFGRKSKSKISTDPRQGEDRFQALSNVHFRCEAGQVMALLGPNGAGKTTALRILAAAIRADAGSIHVEGVDVATSPIEARQRIGFLSGSTALYGRLTVRENVKYFADLHNVSNDEFETRLNQLADRFDMHAYLDKRADSLSTGMKQKASIVRCVIHQPQVIVLDEPTTGLDILSRQAVIDFVLDCKAAGTPVIISTHYLDEVSKLCDRVCVINYGRTVFSDTLEAFENLAEQDLHQSFMTAIAG